MRLKDLLFADGEILRYEYAHGVVRLQFVHYTGDRYCIELRGCDALEEHGSLDTDLADGKICKIDDKWELRLYDGDGLVFRAVYSDAVVLPSK